MDGQTQAPRSRRRRSRAEVEELVAEYAGSGLGRTAFCQQRGLSLSTLARYRRRQEQTVGGSADGKRWLAVEIAGAAGLARGERASGLAVVLPSGRRIEVSRDFDADTLQQLLALMERG